nr:MAG TPA: hypothetical protein [Caudoviricetes sp.]
MCGLVSLIFICLSVSVSDKGGIEPPSLRAALL